MLSVLYVDDEEGLLTLCKIFLERTGEFQVQTEPSAPKALDLLTAQKFDAIISDYQMPVMDGIEFLKRFRATDNTTPFIIFTGRGREEIAIAALKEGADFYLQKGGDPMSQFAELTNQIKQVVRQRKAEQHLRENELLYRTLFESAYDGIFLMDDDVITDCNHIIIHEKNPVVPFLSLRMTGFFSWMMM
jgi:DNA-binding response OmpR family regulator